MSLLAYLEWGIDVTDDATELLQESSATIEDWLDAPAGSAAEQNALDRMYVPGYGEAIAADTGSAVIGNIIDLGFADYEVIDWHTRWVTVYILE